MKKFMAAAVTILLGAIVLAPTSAQAFSSKVSIKGGPDYLSGFETVIVENHEDPDSQTIDYPKQMCLEVDGQKPPAGFITQVFLTPQGTPLKERRNTSMASNVPGCFIDKDGQLLQDYAEFVIDTSKLPDDDYSLSVGEDSLDQGFPIEIKILNNTLNVKWDASWQEFIYPGGSARLAGTFTGPATLFPTSVKIRTQPYAGKWSAYKTVRASAGRFDAGAIKLTKNTKVQVVGAANGESTTFTGTISVFLKLQVKIANRYPLGKLYPVQVSLPGSDKGRCALDLTYFVDDVGEVVSKQILPISKGKATFYVGLNSKATLDGFIECSMPGFVVDNLNFGTELVL